METLNTWEDFATFFAITDEETISNNDYESTASEIDTDELLPFRTTYIKREIKPITRYVRDLCSGRKTIDDPINDEDAIDYTRFGPIKTNY